CSTDADCTAVNSNWACTTTGVPAGSCASTKACTCVTNVCSRHGTAVTSIILGDYTGGQADGIAVGDDTCPNGWTHARSFKRSATGIAPEASLIVWGQQRFGNSGEQEDSLSNAFTSAVGRHVDILNNSWVWNDGDGSTCSPSCGAGQVCENSVCVEAS